MSTTPTRAPVPAPATIDPRVIYEIHYPEFKGVASQAAKNHYAAFLTGWHAAAFKRAPTRAEIELHDLRTTTLPILHASERKLRAALQRYLDCDPARDVPGETPAAQAREALGDFPTRAPVQAPPP